MEKIAQNMLKYIHNTLLYLMAGNIFLFVILLRGILPGNYFLTISKYCSIFGVMWLSAWCEDWERLEPKRTGGTSLVVQVVKNPSAMQGTWVPSLVGELRSHMPQGN